MVSAGAASPPAARSADWQAVADSFYVHRPLYALDHAPLCQLDLADYAVSHAGNGGPVAVMRDPSKPVLLGKYDARTAPASRISVYSSAGALVQHVDWSPPPASSVAHFSLPSPATLLVLLHSGLYRLYTLSAAAAHAFPSSSASYTQHALPHADDLGGVADAFTAPDGAVVVRMHSGVFLELRGLAAAAGRSAAAGAGAFDEAGERVLGARGKGKRRADGGAGAGMAVKVVQLAATGIDGPPDCWTVVPADESAGRSLEVLIAKGTSVYRLDEIDCVEHRLDRGPFLSLTPSPSGRFLAFVLAPSSSSSHHPTLWVTSSDFQRSLSEATLDEAVSEGERGPPRQVAWCGSNAVVVAWERTAVLVGPFGETLKFFYSDPVHLIPELDGTRLLTSSSLHFLSLVPASHASVFLPGSTSPAALLYEAAREFYDRKSPRADEFVRGLGRGKEMREAVEGCVDAAAREWDEREQKRLLRAAAFGKSFLEVYNPNQFVETTQVLRVLNAVRDYKVGIPLTWDQYHSRPPSALIASLLAYNAHLLALRISTFLGLNPAPVIKHWAAQLIAASAPGAATGREPPKSDEEVCRLIVDKLESLSSASALASSTAAASSALLSTAAPGSTTAAAGGAAAAAPALSSADLALTAFRLGRTPLAKLLIDREPRAGKQVPLLLRMGEGEEAGRKAVESGDPELVYEVLLSLRRSLAPGDLFSLLSRLPRSPSTSPSSSSLPSASSRARPTASAASAPPSPYDPPAKDPDALRLFQLLCRQGATGDDLALLRDWWYLDDRRVEMGCENLREAMVIEDFGDKVAKVRQAQKSFAEDKERAFEAKMVDDHGRLLAMQQALEQEATSLSSSGGPPRRFVGASVNETIRQCLLAGMDKKAEKVRSDFKVPDKRFWYLKLRALISLRDWDALDSFAKSKKSPIGYEPFVLELIRAGAHRQATRFVDRCDARNRVELYVKAGEWVAAGQDPNNVIAAQLDELLQEMNTSGA
ncbi:hypothetical protein Rhopal_002267-T1 [Rhodotorula paludigena]|uniref:Vacuolar protein sorting-associated protein 16 homolog n=1 Tax=Rhodotorula paludigena TaxID=86838 RepID=A0AAV5GJR2_9BASI|nr:hypothetical protein Rhopal_002267-T1 [Rhodotorula paludigena]